MNANWSDLDLNEKATILMEMDELRVEAGRRRSILANRIDFFLEDMLRKGETPREVLLSPYEMLCLGVGRYGSYAFPGGSVRVTEANAYVSGEGTIHYEPMRVR
jgi:hypothetical protein